MDKDELRSLGRDRPDVGMSLLVVSALYDWLARRLPGTIAAYLPMSDEVDITSLFDRLPGWRWVLPRLELDKSLTFRDRDVPRETHRWGMRQPVDAGSVVPVFELDVILVPGMAFDRSGARLGRGGGFYDQVLAQRRGDSRAIGIILSAHIVSAVPVHDHDELVDFLATEDGVRECSPSS